MISLPLLRGKREFEPVDQVRVQHVADHDADGEGAEADEQPLTKLVEMLDERCLLAVVQAARPAARTAWLLEEVAFSRAGARRGHVLR